MVAVILRCLLSSVVVVVMVVSACWHAYAAELDSLRSLLSQRAEDTSTVLLLSLLSEKLARSQPHESLMYAEKALRLARQLDFVRGKAVASYNVANAHYRLGNYAPALEYATTAREMYENLADKANVAKCFNRIGTIYRHEQQFPQALAALSESVKLYAALGDSAGMAAPVNNLGETYRSMGNNKAALTYFFQTFALDSALNDTLSMAQDIANVGETYRRLGQVDKALAALRKALDYGGDVYSRSEIIAGLARLFYDMKDFRQARQYASQAVAIDSAAGFKPRLRESLEISALAAAAEQDFRAAYMFQQRLTAISDTLFNEENSKTLAAIQQAAERQRQEAQAALEAQEEQKRVTFRNALIGGGVLVGIIGLLVVRSRRSKARLAEQAWMMRQIEDEKASVERKVEEARRQLLLGQEETRRRDAESLRLVQEQQQYLEERSREILNAMQRFALGDLTVSVPLNSREDDMHKVAVGFNRSVASVRTLVEQVIHNVEQTTAIAAHISSASAQMAATSQEEAAQVSQIATAIEQMARSVTNSASQIQHISQITQHNGKHAMQGAAITNHTAQKIGEIARVVSRAADVVDNLGNSSTEIGEIVQVIEDIADQTNLLALNAAIEAARAGDQGRGFAVVADEVRKLAERTAEATKHISRTIKYIQRETEQAVRGMQQGDNEVQHGLELAQQAGTALQQIVQESSTVETLIDSTAAQMQQQSSTAEELAHSVEHVSSSVHETTASLAEIAHATENLQRLTQMLHDLVGRFQVDSNDSM